MKDKLKQIQQKALSAFQDAREIKDVDDLKVKFLGKEGRADRHSEGNGQAFRRGKTCHRADGE